MASYAILKLQDEPKYIAINIDHVVMVSQGDGGVNITLTQNKKITVDGALRDVVAALEQANKSSQKEKASAPKIHSIAKILGFRLSDDRQSALLGLASDAGQHNLAFSTQLLDLLASTVLKAKAALGENAAAAGAGEAQKLHTMACDKWEIRKGGDRDLLLFGFRDLNGAWFRIQVSREIATRMRETLEVIEGRVNPAPAHSSRN